MPTLDRVFNIPRPPTLLNQGSTRLVSEDMVGVEVELEGFQGRNSIDIDTRWNVITDGSLRNSGLEFVFREPMYGKDVVQCVEALTPAFEEADVVPIISNRCSVHVHLDVRDLEYHQLLNLIVTYLLCEPFFFAVGGEHRRNNMYAMPLATSQDYLNRLGRALRADTGDNGSLFRHQIIPDVKYSAFNVAPVYGQGSVEFRHHQGTYDTEELLHWINMVLCIKRYTRSLGETRMTPRFIDDIVNGGYNKFIREVFDGVDIPPTVDGWDSAATVAKRVASRSMSNSDDYSPMLPPSKVVKHQFFKTQEKVGLKKLTNYKSMVRSMNNIMEEGGVPQQSSPYFEGATAGGTVGNLSVEWSHTRNMYVPRGDNSTSQERLDAYIENLNSETETVAPPTPPVRPRSATELHREQQRIINTYGQRQRGRNNAPSPEEHGQEYQGGNLWRSIDFSTMTATREEE